MSKTLGGAVTGEFITTSKDMGIFASVFTALAVLISNGPVVSKEFC